MPAPFVARDTVVAANSLGTSGTYFVPEPSPSLNEAVLGLVEETDKTRQFGVAAMGHARVAAADAMRGARQAHVDPDLTAPARHRRAAQVAAHSIFPAADTLGKATAAYAKEIGVLGATLAGPKGEFSETQIAEIRTKLAGKPATQRFAAIAKSIEKGSDLAVAALTRSDPLLNDYLTEPETAEVLDLWRRTRFPDEHARHRRLSLDAELLEQAGKILQNYQRSCYNASVVNTPVQLTEHRGNGPRPLNRGAVPGLEARAKAMTAVLARL